jgi:hypothetical protein
LKRKGVLKTQRVQIDAAWYFNGTHRGSCPASARGCRKCALDSSSTIILIIHDDDDNDVEMIPPKKEVSTLLSRGRIHLMFRRVLAERRQRSLNYYLLLEEEYHRVSSSKKKPLALMEGAGRKRLPSPPDLRSASYY